MCTSFYSEEELKKIGLKEYGKDVKISKNTSIYSPQNIIIGDNVRIDDFCILSGSIKLGSHIHIAAFCGFWGTYGITLDDFCNISSKVSIYSVSDSFHGDTLTNPTIPDKFKNIINGYVHLKKHVIIGASTVILPDLCIETGCSIGACSLVNRSTDEWGIYAGIPVKRIKERKKDLLVMEKKFLEEWDMQC